MKKIIVVLVLLCSVFLQGCGVAQEDYDKLEKENDTLSKELREQKEDYSKLQVSYKSSEDKLNEYTQKELELAAPTAWVRTHFGNDCIVLVSNPDYLQIISKTEYTLSTEGIQKIWNNVFGSVSTLATMLDQINYDRISMKFPQIGGKTMLEFVLKKNNNTYTLESINGDMDNATVLQTALALVITK